AATARWTILSSSAATASGRLQSHTPRNRCVRFADTVTSGHATLATKRALPLTWAGLPPAGSHQLAWRTYSITSSDPLDLKFRRLVVPAATSIPRVRVDARQSDQVISPILSRRRRQRMLTGRG